MQTRVNIFGRHRRPLLWGFVHLGRMSLRWQGTRSLFLGRSAGLYVILNNNNNMTAFRKTFVYAYITIQYNTMENLHSKTDKHTVSLI